MTEEAELVLSDGRTLHVYDTRDGRLPVFWHHGTPNTGAPPEPLFPAAATHGVRWISYDRPGYLTSTRRPGRNIASAAGLVSTVADALGIDRFAVIGHSGGGPHALACAALLPERVLSAVCVSGMAPFGAERLDWFAGMGPAGEAELRAAVEGRETLERFLASADWDPEQFTPADHEAITGDWAWLGGIAQQGAAGDAGGTADDNIAYVAPWGFTPGQISAPVLYVHGARDRMVPSTHGAWLARHTRSGELWLRPDDGHISVLRSAAAALDWLVEHADSG